MVKVTHGDLTLVFNPIGQDKDNKMVKFGADIALVALNDEAYNGVDNASRGDKVPFIVDGPGEYEVSEIFICGFASAGPDDSTTGVSKINTIYSLVLDGLKLVHLGALASNDLPVTAAEGLGAIDILFAPVSRAKLVASLESKLIIPVEIENELVLKNFLKELSADGIKPVESLTLKRKDVADKEGEVVVIRS